MTLDFLLSVILVTVSSIIWIWFQFKVLRKKRPSKFPPGPNPLPIIGNLLQLGKNPHQSLAKLSETYGPLMHLKLGSVHTVVVSSPEVAKQVLQKHDRVCSGRAVPEAIRVRDHDRWSLAWSQTGPRWRKLRRICKEELFSAARLVSGERLRAEKMKQMCDYLGDRCDSNRAVNVGEVAFAASLNMMGNTLFSADLASFEDPDSSNEVMGLIRGLAVVSGTPNVSDHFPIFRRFDPQGIRRGADDYAGKLLVIFDDMIDKKLRSSQKKGDLLEGLIEINQDDESYVSRDEINHLLLDLIIAGVDSTANTVEWAMTLLLRNPEKLSKAKDELEAVIGNDKAQIEESDISRLSYLNAVVKETLRLHPPGPFLVPHKAESDVEIDGYTIPKDANILFNVWAIGRDSRVWSDNPERFEPERFLESKIDYRGKDFELIPFSSGRRICPGLPLAHVVVHLMLASLIHRFDWIVDEEMRSQSLDVTEKFGLAAHKAMPLMAFVTKSRGGATT